MDLDLIKINLDVNDNEEVINELGTMLLKKGYVKDTYICCNRKRKNITNRIRFRRVRCGNSAY